MKSLFPKGAKSILIKIELLISRHYSAYLLLLERFSDPNIMSKKDIVNSILSFPYRRGYKLAQRNTFFLRSHESGYNAFWKQALHYVYLLYDKTLLNIFRLLRARRALTLYKEVPLRTECLTCSGDNCSCDNCSATKAPTKFTPATIIAQAKFTPTTIASAIIAPTINAPAIIAHTINAPAIIAPATIAPFSGQLVR